MPLQADMTPSGSRTGVFGWISTEGGETTPFRGSTADLSTYAVRLDSGFPAWTHSTEEATATDLASMREIRYAGRRFRLKRRLWVRLDHENDVWYAENPAFGIIAYGDSIQEALNSFQEDFAVLWEEIAQAPNEELSAEARRVKESFREIVEAVEGQ